MIDMKHAGFAGNRIFFLDNLRTFMIFLVVVVHAGIVYDGSGGGAYFWLVFDLSTNAVSGILNMVVEIMVMPVIFFVSGFFAPLSLEKRGGWTFLTSRFKRLIIPWVIAVLTLIPLYKVIFLYSRNLSQENWTTYFHFSNGFISQSWLWFLPVLFLFDGLYLLISKIDLAKITFEQAVGSAFLLGFINMFGMAMLGGQGWTKTIALDFQNERLLIYFMLFLLGSLCFKQRTFESSGKNKKLYIVLAFTAWIPVYLYISLHFHSMRHIGRPLVSGIVDAALLQLALLLSMLCLLYLTINTFRYFLNKPYKMGKELNKNSYGVYVIHTIVLGGIALSMLDVAVPSLLKHLILTVATYIACNLIVSFYRNVVKSKISKPGKEKAMKTAIPVMLIVSLLAAAGCAKRENSAPRISLHAAALEGNVDVIRQHIKAGSDLDKKDMYGSTPLIIAVTFGRTEAAGALIEGGADMGISNNEGSTPLHIAAFLCRTEIVQALLDNGADKNLENDQGSTVLDVVAGPFADVKEIYDGIGKALAPLGLELDYERIKATRPRIAEMLR